MTGEDRLEVTQTTTAYCEGADVDPDALKAAVQKLDGLSVDRNKVVVIGQATLSQMDVEYLHSISQNATAAATP
jgi:hypothetical protein